MVRKYFHPRKTQKEYGYTLSSANCFLLNKDTCSKFQTKRFCFSVQFVKDLVIENVNPAILTINGLEIGNFHWKMAMFSISTE